jgi:hypothetical protein
MVKPLYLVDTNERRQSVPRVAFIPPKDATKSLPPVFSDSDDECDDPLATRLTTDGQPPKPDGDSELVSAVEAVRISQSHSDSPPGEIWAMLIAEETTVTSDYSLWSRTAAGFVSASRLMKHDA